ncbi:hypothetical protein E4T89_04190 [Jeotgalicoccus nanhaiensis]|uniref:KAP NTPase domain-containing protein n=1 Tax=Jeotgalicoccus nanhaiensis TaxID=568603 RepID=A0ABR9XWT3_9STAP|nr:hypothetical protein [Jeotgalicoccus nanhaiensis]MBF0753463.1 hypothetical protein [Jeotgalicoccus nanhaiensis]TFU62621.1 hypothetical protein E4T89_04190 [Jeotgalicoccus nanhaiensis]
MEAAKIKEVIERLEGLPYQKILFNGPWGVGKTKYILDSVKKMKIYIIYLYLVRIVTIYFMKTCTMN